MTESDIARNQPRRGTLWILSQGDRRVLVEVLASGPGKIVAKSPGGNYPMQFSYRHWLHCAPVKAEGAAILDFLATNEHQPSHDENSEEGR